jgi:hypothetical protein
MPFKSEAQRKFMYAAEERGDLPKGTAARWEEHTIKKDLPDKVNKKANLSSYSVNRDTNMTDTTKTAQCALQDRIKRAYQEYYDTYSDTPPPQFALPLRSMAAGAAVGGVGAHMFPGPLATALKEMAKSAPLEDTALKQVLKRKAFGANLGRLGKGVILGAAAGGLAHEVLK